MDKYQEFPATKTKNMGSAIPLKKKSGKQGYKKRSDNGGICRGGKTTRRFPPYRYFENFFCHYVKNGKGKILLTRFQGKIIGGSILGFENKSTAYCLYYWGKSKRHKLLYPTVFTLYSAMKMAEEQGFYFFDFMDVGFLHKRAGRSRFLLQFGGKERATRRWYRFNWGLLNFFANKIYD